MTGRASDAGVWLHAAQLSAGRPAVLQRDEGEEGGGAAITEASVL
jgi:hypothetical protein